MKKNCRSQQGQRIYCDALVLGTGIAGLTYALALSVNNPTIKICLLSKGEFAESNSWYAQGGIAVAAQQAESLSSHLQDTLKAGDGLSYEQAAKKIVEMGAFGIKYLEKHGVDFIKDTTGEPDLAQEGGHSQRRIYHHNDATGKVIIQSLIAAIKKQSNIHGFEYHTAINLITQIPFHSPGRLPEVIGAYALDEKSALIHTFLSKVVILATGGAGKVYRYTTNPDVATGDGIAMAYRAGARVGNMEFYQFHPTLLYHPENRNFLISEALRGEGAVLRLKNGERFMKKYAPEQMELATRDVVARAIFSEIENTADSCVYLDISHKEKAFLEERFPTITAELATMGIDISQDLIPVVPAAHYLCGGVLTDTDGRTDLSRLFAIGEAGFTGMHGANRLASNSLLEALVIALNASKASQAHLEKKVDSIRNVSDWDSENVSDTRRVSQINAHWRGLRNEMTSYAGIIRTGAGLRDLKKLIRARREMIEAYYWKYNITRDLIELRNIVLTAELMVRSALQRKESRGAHFREDYPQKSDKVEETLLSMTAVPSIDTTRA